MVLKRCDILMWGEDLPLEFRLGPFFLWLAPCMTVGLRPVNGSWDLPAAVINGPAPVAATTAAWGAVKSLYR